MIKKIKLHIQKFIFYDLLAIFIFIVFNIFFINLIIDIQENQKSKYDYSNYDDTIRKIYTIDSSLFQFNEDGVAIVKMDDLLKPITNGKDTMYFGIVPLTDEQDQCVGYFIVTKKENELQIDSSHLCDMVDY